MRPYVALTALRAYAAERTTCTGLSHVVTRAALLQASAEPSLTVCRYSALRKSTGWFRSAEAARPSWTFPKRPIALAKLNVTPGEVFAVKTVRRHPEFILQPGRVRYPSHEYITAQNFN